MFIFNILLCNDRLMYVRFGQNEGARVFSRDCMVRAMR